jgi:hypothetical protein
MSAAGAAEIKAIDRIKTLAKTTIFFMLTSFLLWTLLNISASTVFNAPYCDMAYQNKARYENEKVNEKTPIIM